MVLAEQLKIQDGVDRYVIRQARTALKELKLDQEREGANGSTAAAHQSLRRGGRPTGGYDVVVHKDDVSFVDGVFMDFDRVRAVFEVIRLRDGAVWEFAPFPNRNEATTEGMRDAAPEDKASGLDSEHLGDAFTHERLYEEVDRKSMKLRVREDRRDILEEDPRLREVRNVSDGGRQLINFVDHYR